MTLELGVLAYPCRPQHSGVGSKRTRCSSTFLATQEFEASLGYLKTHARTHTLKSGYKSLRVLYSGCTGLRMHCGESAGPTFDVIPCGHLETANNFIFNN